jgi:hypothetical protein
MLAKKTSKNQITLPKVIADFYAGIQYFDVSIKNNKILFVPVIMTPVKRPGLGGRGRSLRGSVRRARKQ